MTHPWAVMLLALCISIVCSRHAVHAQPLQQLNPKAAQQFATDSEKASAGDADAAYRMGEAFESGRLGGLKDLSKALTYYRMAAQNGHQDAAARVTQIEAKLGINQKQPPAISQGH